MSYRVSEWEKSCRLSGERTDFLPQFTPGRKTYFMRKSFKLWSFMCKRMRKNDCISLTCCWWRKVIVFAIRFQPLISLLRRPFIFFPLSSQLEIKESIINHSWDVKRLANTYHSNDYCTLVSNFDPTPFSTRISFHDISQYILLFNSLRVLWKSWFESMRKVMTKREPVLIVDLEVV